MKRLSWILVGTVVLAAAAACGDTKSSSGDTTATADTATAPASASASATASAEASAEPAASASAEPAASASAEPAASATANATAATTGGPTTAPAPATTATASATAAANKYDCGGKGQKSCPMQGWMKGVMARAIAGGDKDKIANALSTIAAKPVAGMGQWSAIAAEGAAKASGGDIDGAKASCKKCHALYQKKYKDTMRDQPW